MFVDHLSPMLKLYFIEHAKELFPPIGDDNAVMLKHLRALRNILGGDILHMSKIIRESKRAPAKHTGGEPMAVEGATEAGVTKEGGGAMAVGWTKEGGKPMEEPAEVGEIPKVGDKDQERLDELNLAISLLANMPETMDHMATLVKGFDTALYKHSDETRSKLRDHLVADYAAICWKTQSY
jgi:hypothetical protein